MKRVISIILTTAMLFGIVCIGPGVGAVDSAAIGEFLIFRDDFETGMLPSNWLRGDFNNFFYTEHNGNGVVAGYHNATSLQSNFQLTSNPKIWDKFYACVDVNVRDLDAPNDSVDTGKVGMWYRELFEDVYYSGEGGPAYTFWLDVTTGVATLEKGEHNFIYVDENGSLKAANLPAMELARVETGRRFALGELEEEEWFNIGMRVTDGKIECFLDDECIISCSSDSATEKIGQFNVDAVNDTVGKEKSAILLLNDNLYLYFDNFEVWDPCCPDNLPDLDTGDIFFNDNFDNIARSKHRFDLGNYQFGRDCIYVDSGVNVLQTRGEYDDNGFYKDTPYTYLTYDAVANINIYYSNEGSLALSYVNDNRRYNGLSDDREYMNFVLDVKNQQVYVTYGDAGSDREEDMITDAIDYTIVYNGPMYEIGMSVTKDSVRFFIDGELIFDISDEKYCIAHDIESPFFLWTSGSGISVFIDSVRTAPAGSIFPDLDVKAEFILVPHPVYEGDEYVTLDLVLNDINNSYITSSGFYIGYPGKLSAPTFEKPDNIALSSANIEENPVSYVLVDTNGYTSGVISTITFPIARGAAVRGDTYKFSLKQYGDVTDFEFNPLDKLEMRFTGCTVEVMEKEKPEYEYTILDDGTISITKYNGSEANLLIPGEIDGYTVTEIGKSAFSGCTFIETITIPDSVTSIGMSAFYGCSSLTDVYYGGTREQWKSFNYFLRARVHCIDGELIKVEFSLVPHPVHEGDEYVTVDLVLDDVYGIWISASGFSIGYSDKLSVPTFVKSDSIESSSAYTELYPIRYFLVDADGYTTGVISTITFPIASGTAVRGDTYEISLEQYGRISDYDLFIIDPEEMSFTGCTVEVLSHEHEFSEWHVTSSATCTENGEERRECEICGDAETREIPALGHSEVVDQAVPATCTASGLTEGKHCSVCGEMLAAQETIPALGHEPGEWITVTEPTATETGVREQHCVRCDEVIATEEIPVISVPAGDADGDGEITTEDVVLSLRFLAGWDVDIDLEAADVNHDGEVNLIDAVLLLQYLAGWDVEI